MGAVPRDCQEPGTAGLPAGSLQALGSMEATRPVPLRGALHLADGMHSLHGKQGSHPRGERLERDKINVESDLTVPLVEAKS